MVIEDFKTSPIWAALNETYTFDADENGGLHLPHSAGTKMRHPVTLTGAQALRSSWGECCAAKAKRFSDEIVFSDELALVDLLELLDAVESGVPSEFYIGNLEFMAPLVMLGANPMILDAFDELVKVGREKLKIWAVSSQATDLLDMVTSLTLAGVPLDVLQAVKNTSELPFSFAEYVTALGFSETKTAKLIKYHAVRPRPEGSILLKVTGKFQLVNRVALVNDALTAYRVSKGLYALPAKFQPVLDASTYTFDWAPLPEGAPRSLVETAGVFLSDGYPDVESALKAAQALEES